MKKRSKSSEFARLGDLITGNEVAKPVRVLPAVKSKQLEIGQNGVTADCLSYLSGLGLYYPCKAERMATGGAFTANGQALHFGRAGRADIYLTLAGRAYFIETKSGKGGWLSIEQWAFKKRVLAAGAVYWVVCSRQELEVLLAPILATCPKKQGTADFVRDADGNITLI